jgi:hypothetical protein
MVLGRFENDQHKCSWKQQKFGCTERKIEKSDCSYQFKLISNTKAHQSPLKSPINSHTKSNTAQSDQRKIEKLDFPNRIN